MPLKEDIQFVISGEAEDSETVLAKHSKDWSIFKVMPQLVVFPKNAADVMSLVSFVNSAKGKGVTLTGRSGGSDMTGGPLSQSVVVDFARHMNIIGRFGKETAVVQPGVFYRDFEKEAAKKNLLLPSYPASKSICAIGGMVGNNAGGEKSLVYGKTAKYVKQLKVVFSDGNEYTLKPLSKAELEKKMALKTFEGSIYKKMFEVVDTNYDILQQAKPKVSKNSAGYALWNVWDKKTFDLTQLFVGSQGTLGLTTEVQFRLVTPKKHMALLVVFLKDIRKLATVTERMLEKNPESFESYDDKTMQLALKFLPSFIKILGASNIFSLALRFIPEAFMVLTGGVPKLILLAEFTADTEEEAKAKAVEAKKYMKGMGLRMRCTKDEKEVDKYFAIRRESFKLLHSKVKGLEAASFIEDFVVRPAQLPEFLVRLDAILKHYKKYMVYTIAGHVGDANFHIIPLMDMSRPEVHRVIPELMEKVHMLIFEFEGTFTGEHNDGILRTPYLKDMYGEKIVSLFERVKDIFDPKNVFNPGKKVKGTADFAKKHMIWGND